MSVNDRPAADDPHSMLRLLAGSAHPTRSLWGGSATDPSQNHLSHFRTLWENSEDEDWEMEYPPPFHLQPEKSLVRIDQQTQGIGRTQDLFHGFQDIPPVLSNSTQVETCVQDETRTEATTTKHLRHLIPWNGEGTSDVVQSVPPTSSEDESCPRLKIKHLCQIFPFYVALNCRSEIIQVGPGLTSLTISPESIRAGHRSSFADCFDIQHPVLSSASDLFDLLDPDAPLNVTVRPKRTSGLPRLKGELHSLPELSVILFLPYPLPTCDVTPSYVARRDLARDLVNISQAVRRERLEQHRLLRVLVDLRGRRSKVETDKGQTDDLLSSIFPSFVVERLRMRRAVDPVTFELVTILFADIVQFTALCGDPSVTPMDVVRMLNQLYTQFDLLSSLNDVYKVETIGDAYMVVGGFPVFTSRHADVVISMAFEMIRASQSVCSPVNHQPLQVRIGVHSGPCVAGVVGHVMPRYCLFGRSVALANQMETLSEPDMINISEDTLRCISLPDVYQFEENFNVPPDLPCRSFFISQTPASPVLHTLELPVPRGLFRTPAATPNNSPSRHASRQTTPHGSPEEGKATPQGTPTRHGLTDGSASTSPCRSNSTLTTPHASPLRHYANQSTPNGTLFRFSPFQTTPNGSPIRNHTNQTTPSGSHFQCSPTETTPNGSLFRYAPTETMPNDLPCWRNSAHKRVTCNAEAYESPSQVNGQAFHNSIELGNEKYNTLFSCATSFHRHTCQSYFNHAPEIHLNDSPVHGNTAHNVCASLTTEQCSSQSSKSISNDNQSRQSNEINDQSPFVTDPTTARGYSWCCFSSNPSSTRPVATPTSEVQQKVESIFKIHHDTEPPSECLQTKFHEFREKLRTRSPRRSSTNGLQLLSREELQQIKRNSRLVFYFRPQARSMSPSSERSNSEDARRRSESVWCFRDINEFLISEADDQR